MGIWTTIKVTAKPELIDYFKKLPAFNFMTETRATDENGDYIWHGPDRFITVPWTFDEITPTSVSWTWKDYGGVSSHAAALTAEHFPGQPIHLELDEEYWLHEEETIVYDSTTDTWNVSGWGKGLDQEENQWNQDTFNETITREQFNEHKTNPYILSAFHGSHDPTRADLIIYPKEN